MDFKLEKDTKKPICLVCHTPKKVNEIEIELLRKEKENNNYGNKYSDKINLKSNGKTVILKYYGYKSNAKVGCLTCGHIWKIIIDRLLEKCYYPNCKNSKVNS